MTFGADKLFDQTDDGDGAASFVHEAAESALTSTVDAYKKLFDPFVLEEVRASICRQLQDPAQNVRGK